MASTGMTAEQLLAQHNSRLAGRFITPMTKKQKIASFRANFAFFDIDNSGTMSAQEFLQVLLEEGESIVFKSAAKLSTAAALGGGQGSTEYA